VSYLSDEFFYDEFAIRQSNDFKCEANEQIKLIK
jgi:hypothetical protein